MEGGHADVGVAVTVGASKKAQRSVSAAAEELQSDLIMAHLDGAVEGRAALAITRVKVDFRSRI